MSELQALGIRPVINATGPWTRMGNATPSARVRHAMDEAAAAFIPFNELQEIASGVIAETTGSEAGYVTAGAASALTLAIAACIAGEDPDRIRTIPHLTEPPHAVLMFEQQRWFYDVAIRATGARLRTIDAFAPDALAQLEHAIDASIACIFYDCTGLPYRDQTGIPSLAAVVDIAHRHNVKVVADASMALPPAHNLRALVATGADAIAFSGGKALQGPPASGFLACRRSLIRSVGVQHQDVNVFAELTGMIDPTKLYMGIGRSHKVGKEQIVGLIVALKDYARRDHDAERAEWRARLRRVEARLLPIPGITVRWLEEDDRAPYLMIGFEGPLSHLTPPDVSRRLLEGTPRIFCAAHRGNALWLGAETMTSEQADIVGINIAKIASGVNW